ncbi:GL19775 [Drosophila persimilis]|uniref:GL19775 n=1 Tax=Drosophila persimilis TaxID=7234 RepID=B4GYM5_DROPE|nr:GL19775 [Drosophila persimilis]
MKKQLKASFHKPCSLSNDRRYYPKNCTVEWRHEAVNSQDCLGPRKCVACVAVIELPMLPYCDEIMSELMTNLVLQRGPYRTHIALFVNREVSDSMVAIAAGFVGDLCARFGPQAHIRRFQDEGKRSKGLRARCGYGYGYGSESFSCSPFIGRTQQQQQQQQGQKDT